MKLNNLYDALGYKRKQNPDVEEAEDVEKQKEIKKREMEILAKPTINMPTPSFASNLEAPTPMKPNGRYTR